MPGLRQTCGEEGKATPAMWEIFGSVVDVLAAAPRAIGDRGPRCGTDGQYQAHALTWVIRSGGVEAAGQSRVYYVMRWT